MGSETLESRTWKKKVGREDCFTFQFRFLHVLFLRFSRPAFFFSRSIFTFFTFQFRFFHIPFSRFSRYVFGAFAAENVKCTAVIEFLHLYLIRGINAEIHAGKVKIALVIPARGER